MAAALKVPWGGLFPAAPTSVPGLTATVREPRFLPSLSKLLEWAPDQSHEQLQSRAASKPRASDPLKQEESSRSLFYL